MKRLAIQKRPACHFKSGPIPVAEKAQSWDDRHVETMKDVISFQKRNEGEIPKQTRSDPAARTLAKRYGRAIESTRPKSQKLQELLQLSAALAAQSSGASSSMPQKREAAAADEVTPLKRTRTHTSANDVEDELPTPGSRQGPSWEDAELIARSCRKSPLSQTGCPDEMKADDVIFLTGCPDEDDARELDDLEPTASSRDVAGEALHMAAAKPTVRDLFAHIRSRRASSGVSSYLPRYATERSQCLGLCNHICNSSGNLHRAVFVGPIQEMSARLVVQILARIVAELQVCLSRVIVEWCPDWDLISFSISRMTKAVRDKTRNM